MDTIRLTGYNKRQVDVTACRRGDPVPLYGAYLHGGMHGRSRVELITRRYVEMLEESNRHGGMHDQWYLQWRRCECQVEVGIDDNLEPFVLVVYDVAYEVTTLAGRTAGEECSEFSMRYALEDVALNLDRVSSGSDVVVVGEPHACNSSDDHGSLSDVPDVRIALVAKRLRTCMPIDMACFCAAKQMEQEEQDAEWSWKRIPDLRYEWLDVDDVVHVVNLLASQPVQFIRRICA